MLQGYYPYLTNVLDPMEVQMDDYLKEELEYRNLQMRERHLRKMVRLGKTPLKDNPRSRAAQRRWAKYRLTKILAKSELAKADLEKYQSLMTPRDRAVARAQHARSMRRGEKLLEQATVHESAIDRMRAAARNAREAAPVVFPLPEPPIAAPAPKPTPPADPPLPYAGALQNMFATATFVPPEYPGNSVPTPPTPATPPANALEAFNAAFLKSLK